MTHAEDIEDTDPGLARERTELAWTRTAISFAALGAAIVKSHPLEGLPILALSAVIWKLGRLARAHSDERERPRRLLVIAVAVTAVSLAALAISLLGRQSAGLRF
jgi:uncharacterized membrane protein YidH (DUF202 family)